MIALAGLLGLMAFVVTSLVVGGRILLLAWRTRLLPETTAGASLVLAGGAGTALAVLPLLLPFLSDPTSYLLYTLSILFNHVGYIFLLIFVWRVFRPSELWGAFLFWGCTIALFVGGTLQLTSLEVGGGLPGSGVPADTAFWWSLIARFIGYSWATFESFRYYSLLKRRLVLGLAEEAVVKRFLKWGICMGSVVLIWINEGLQQIFVDTTLYQNVADLISAGLGFIVAVVLWQAFFQQASPDTAPQNEASTSMRQSNPAGRT